ncbi:MAG: hypothetical protein ACKO7B_04420 [Flavobacteriales bacterium]
MRILLFLALALIAACSPVTLVKPLEKNQWAASATLGGPLIGFGSAVIPVPFTSLGAAYGINERTSVSARIHTTAALFGVAQIDAGYLRQIRKQQGAIPGISAMGQGTFMVDRWKGIARFYPQLDLNAWWDVGQKGHYCYTGLSSWYELQSKGTGDRNQPANWIPAWNVGFCREHIRWSTRFELKYMAPFSSHESLTVDYKAPGSAGAVGVFVGFMRKF